MKLLMIVGGLLVLVIVVSFAKPSLDDQRTELNRTNQTLTEKLNEINELEANLASYRTQTEEFTQKNQEILDEFPAEVRCEDAILYSKNLQDSVDMEITSVSISDGNLLYAMNDTTTTDAAAVSEDEDSDETTTDTTADASADTTASSEADGIGVITASQVEKPNYSLFDVVVSYDFSIGYDDLKKIFAGILADSDKKNVPSISVAYDTETGLLSGNMSVNMYYLTGTDKAYETPSAGKVKKGKDNVFGTLKTSSSKKSN
jgi:hypothetical protein